MALVADDEKKRHGKVATPAVLTAVGSEAMYSSKLKATAAFISTE